MKVSKHEAFISVILMHQSNWLKGYLAPKILIKYIVKEISFWVLFSR